MNLKDYIRTVPDYPKPGIQFRDITTLLANADSFQESSRLLTKRYSKAPIDIIAGIESRGFIFGAALAQTLNMGFVPIRKKGKLPGDVFAVSYELEYGADQLEIHQDAFAKNKNVLLIDDLLATGGTALAAAELVRKAGGNIHEAAFIIDLPDLNGKKRLEQNGLKCFCLIEFEGH